MHPRTSAIALSGNKGEEEESLKNFLGNATHIDYEGPHEFNPNREYWNLRFPNTLMIFHHTFWENNGIYQLNQLRLVVDKSGSSSPTIVSLHPKIEEDNYSSVSKLTDSLSKLREDFEALQELVEEKIPSSVKADSSNLSARNGLKS